VVANGVGCISELARNTAAKKKGQKKKGKKVGSPIRTPVKKARSCWHALLIRIFVELCGECLRRGRRQHYAFSARSDVAIHGWLRRCGCR